jgi:hypothetical protein
MSDEAHNPKTNEESLVNLYKEVAGCSELGARSVLMFLDVSAGAAKESEGPASGVKPAA